MGNAARSPRLAGLVFAILGLTGATAQAPAAVSPDCSTFTLDGYRLGMRGDEILAVRSVTLHVERQAQAIVPGKFRGVLVLDATDRLEKWDVRYEAADAKGVRAEMRARLGEPTSDVSGKLSGEDSDAARQRRTIWWSTSCDAAIIVYDNTGVEDAAGHAVSATLVRASKLPPGLAGMKTLYP
jgi:hypothetical protein